MEDKRRQTERLYQPGSPKPQPDNTVWRDALLELKNTAPVSEVLVDPGGPMAAL